MKALQKEPAKRFQSGREMAEALKECLGGGKREEAATTTQAHPVQRRRIGYAIPLAGAALISIIAGGIFFFSDQQVTSPVKKSLETRKASLPVPQRTVLINPSIPPNAPTIKQGEAPVKGMPKEMSKPAPSNVQIESVAKQTVKPDAKPAKDRKPFIPPITAQERPAVKKAESSAARLTGDVNAARPNPVATEKPVIDKPPRQSGVTQPPLPVKSTPLPKFAFLRVRTNPKGATVYVNGSPKGTSPLTLKLGLGKYRVKLCRAGYRDTECLVGLDRMADYPIIEKLRPIE
jgi:hypothetical protein